MNPFFRTFNAVVAFLIGLALMVDGILRGKNGATVGGLVVAGSAPGNGWPRAEDDLATTKIRANSLALSLFYPLSMRMLKD